MSFPTLFLGKKLLLLLPLLMCFTSRVGGKIFRRCELAHLLKVSGLEGYRGYSLADWVCLAFYESHFDTAIVDHEADGSTSNGIFQINSHLWCEDYKHFQPNFCKMHCSDLLTSDIKDDIVCAMRIAQGPRGLGAWMGWRENCEGLDLSAWLKGCIL
ncbi:sperm acrosome membrane-associated protein 3-like [Podarcis muralis]|uniref:sperm acrosome membrane-associated protein 3-like n=1 Tax=Podarcis muralis TaxID=64176 RepID=UPI00109F8C70|nr:sperm acrosome membrane-associated protein 3-like [Podarcis muralis]